MKQYFRHGDVHLIRIEAIPSDADPTQDKTVEEGELTGHAHRIVGDGSVIHVTKSGARFLRVVQPTDLSHEEHHTRTIPPGDYEIRRTRETDHMEGVTRVVAD